MDPEKRKRLLIIVCAICLGGWAADRLVVTPILNGWQLRATRIRDLDKQVAESTGLLDREAELKRRWQDMRHRALPNRVSEAESTVLQSVTKWAGDSSLSVTSLKPRWNRIAPIAQTLEIQLEGTGNMEALSKFLYALESAPLPLRVEDLQITAQDEKGQTLRLSLRFTGLVLEEVQS